MQKIRTVILVLLSYNAFTTYQYRTKMPLIAYTKEQIIFY